MIPQEFFDVFRTGRERELMRLCLVDVEKSFEEYRVWDELYSIMSSHPIVKLTILKSVLNLCREM
jgi:hypothetical protein